MNHETFKWNYVFVVLASYRRHWILNKKTQYSWPLILISLKKIRKKRFLLSTECDQRSILCSIWLFTYTILIKWNLRNVGIELNVERFIYSFTSSFYWCFHHDLPFSGAPQKPLEGKLKLILIHVFAMGCYYLEAQTIDFRFLTRDIVPTEWRIMRTAHETLSINLVSRSNCFPSIAN